MRRMILRRPRVVRCRMLRDYCGEAVADLDEAEADEEYDADEYGG